MAGQSVNFDFTSTGADRLAGDFRKVGGNAELAAKGAKALKESLDKQQGTAPKTAAEMAALARAVRIFGDDADKAALKALAADAAIRGLGDAAGKAGREAEAGSAGFSGLAGAGGIPGGGMGAAIAAGVALAPVLVTVGVGLAGVAAAAVSTVGPILKAGTATKQARDALAGLDPAQKAAYDSLGKLKEQFAGFGKALEPTVLDLFNKGLHIASGLMTDIAPVAKNVGDALGLVLGAVDKEFRSGTWQQFFKFMAATAGPDVKMLGDLFVALLGDLPPLLEQLQPLAVGLLQTTTVVLKLVGGLEKFHLILPLLGAAIGFMVGGPVGALIGAAAGAGVSVAGLGRHAEKLTGQIQVAGNNVRQVSPAVARFGTSAEGAGTAVKDLGKHTAALATVTHDTAPVTQIMADNLYVEKVNAALANDSVTALNTAWSTFLGMSTSLETAQLGIIGALRTLATQAGKAGASFRGTNDASVTLQTTFESSLLPSVENVIGSMRTAHATTHDLAQVIATDLKPAVDHGALSNTAYKNQLYDLAVQAGYTGPNKLAPLKAWFDRNAASTDAAKAAVDRYAGALAKIPSTVHTTIIAEASGTGTIAITGSGWALGQGNIRFHAAAGAFIRAGSGPTADDVPAMLSKGELVVPARMVSAGAVDHLRGMVPGFAAGGLVGLGGQVSAAPGQAGTITGNLAGQAIHTGVNQAMAKAHAQVAARAFDPFKGISGVPLGGGPTSGSAAVAQAFAKSIMWAYGWGMNQWPYLQALWQQESGWNSYAANPASNARGIPQNINGWSAYAPGDYQAQIRWGMSYIKNRPGYGTPAAAWAHEKAFNWYASGGLVGKEGAAFLRAWQDRHGGGYGAAWGPVVVNRQIDSANAALTRNTTLAHASLPASQHRHYVGAAAWWKRHRDALVHERGILRDWRGQLGGSDHALSSWVAAAGSNRALAPSVRRWKAQRAHQEREINAVSRALGWSAAQQAAIDKARPKPPAPTGVQAKHTYGGDVTDSIGAFLSSVAAPFGAARGALVMDRGGWLAPGWNATYNATGRPEHLVPTRGGDGGGVHLHLTVNAPVGSAQQLEDWFVRVANKTAQHGRLTQAVRAASR